MIEDFSLVEALVGILLLINVRNFHYNPKPVNI